MRSSSVVLLQGDPNVEQILIPSLSQAYQAVHVVPSIDTALGSAVKHRAEAVIVDMEMISLNDLRNLVRELPHVRIVCNHRLADEKLWLAALDAGAADCCASFDPGAIVRAALGNRELGNGGSADFVAA